MVLCYRWFHFLIRCDGDIDITVSDDCIVICVDLTAKLFTLRAHTSKTD